MSEVNDEMTKRGYNMCRDFLGRTWAKIRPEEFNIEPISGSLSNMLYRCSLADSVVVEKGEQRKVMLRIYGQIIQENQETVVIDSVVFGILAEKKMGPKLYGVFTGGRIEEYVPSRHLYTSELFQPAISRACAVIMAKFHQLSMPLCKEPRWLFDTIHRYLDEAMNNMTSHHRNPQEAEQMKQLLSYDLPTEVENLKYLLSQVNSPVVFCHNDLQEGNILYVQHSGGDGQNDGHSDGQSDGHTGWAVRPIDFEYASYNYRGFDLGNHFCEWCYDYSVQQAPYYAAHIENYPTPEKQLNFIRAYMEVAYPDGLSDPEEMEQSMMVEANSFALASHMLWGLWSIVQAHISTINFNYLDYALVRFNHYFYQKARLTNDIKENGVVHNSQLPPTP